MHCEHYDPGKHDLIIDEWWRAIGAEGLIPPGTTSPFGGVVSDASGPVMAGFLYLSIGCTACFAERLIARPGNTTRQAREAGTMLFGFLCELAKQHGYEHIYCHVERPQLVLELIDLGFTLTGSNASILTSDLTRP